MTFLSTSLFSAMSTGIRIISGFMITKIVAMHAGPSGLALVGQFQNFITLVILFSGDLFKTATTKYTAEYHEDNTKTYALWSSLFLIILLLNSICFVILFMFSNEISTYVLYNESYAFLFQILALSLPFIVLNTMLLSILNGKLRIKKYIIINILLSVVSLVLIYFLSTRYGINGTLLAYILNQAIIFFITLFFIGKEPWFKIRYFLQGLNKAIVKNLLAFAMITFTAIFASNITLMYIRDFITQTISLQSAGLWQGMWTLSQVLVLFVTTSLVTYFLPKISIIQNKSEISKELYKVFIVAIPVSIVLALGIYIFRDVVISLLYTDGFLPMRELFMCQMVGTVIKIMSWIVGYVFVAKAMVKYTVITEIGFAATLMGLVYLFVNDYGLIGATYAYAMTSLFHLMVMLYLYEYKFMKECKI